MNKIFNKSKRKKGVIRIQLNNPDGEAYHGIVVNNQKSFVAIRELRELEKGGIIFLLKKLSQKYAMEKLKLVIMIF